MPLNDLTHLVKNNQIDAIREIIAQEKNQRGQIRQWNDKYYVENAMRDAILENNIELLLFFLGEGAEPSARALTETGCLAPLIYFAAKTGSLPIVKLLLENGHRIALRDKQFENGDDSAMRAAIENGHLNIVEYLLEQGAAANGRFTGRFDISFLGKAAANGHVAIVEALVRYGANIKNALYLNYLKFADESEWRTRELTNQFGDRQRDYIKKYNPKGLGKFDLDTQALVHKIAQLKADYENSVKILLDCTTGIDFKKEGSGLLSATYDGLTFLRGLNIAYFNFIGISVDGKPIDRTMLQKKAQAGADAALITFNNLINLNDKVRQKKLLSCIEVAIQQQGALIDKDGIINLVPLDKAAEIGNIPAVKARLAAGINPNTYNKQDFSNDCPIVLAAKNGHFEIVKMLAENPKIDNKSIIKALKVAEQSKHKDIINYLFKKQDINALTIHGNALLHIAIANCDIDQVRILIQQGANVNFLNAEEITPLQMAARLADENGANLVEILLENGADPSDIDNDIRDKELASLIFTSQQASRLEAEEQTKETDLDLHTKEKSLLAGNKDKFFKEPAAKPENPVERKPVSQPGNNILKFSQ